MNTAKQVDEEIRILKAGGIPLSDAAWQTALECVGWPYVYGAWGELCTPDGRKRRKRDDHPTIVSKCQVLSGKRSTCDGCKWMPDGERVRMYDCRGFTDWVLKQFGIDLQGEGATSQWTTESNWSAKGEIRDCPDNILVCLFTKKGAKMSHTGLGYHGETCECSAGVQHFSTRNKKWTHWAIPRGIGDPDPDYVPKKPTLRRGSKGEAVKELQTELIKRGYDLGSYGADGSFGKATEAAVKAFQKDRGLNADGIVGEKTWEALETPDVELYTVTIPHLAKHHAEALVSNYAGATMERE